MNKIIIFILSLLLLLGISTFFLTKVQNIEYEEIIWDSAPKKIAITDVTREEKEGTLVVRLIDGKEQFFFGSWNASFGRSDNVFIFGSEEGNTDEEKNEDQAIYHIGTDDRIKQIRVKKELGEIQNVVQDETLSYLIIEFFNKNTSGICVTPYDDSENIKCSKIIIYGDIESKWNPENTHEALFQNTSDESQKVYYSIDMWEEDSFRTHDSESERYSEIANYFNEKRENDLDEKIYTFLNLAFIKNKNGYSIQQVPKNSSVDFFTDSNHLIIKTNNEVLVQEVSTKKRALLYNIPRAQEKNILFKGLATQSSQI